MYIIDEKKFYEALKKRGYRTIGDLAKTLGIHRNTIHYYLSGHGVFPEKLEQLLNALDLKPQDALIRREEVSQAPLQKIVPVVDQLQSEFPDMTFVLFGSRAEGRAKKYSDWDIGVYAAGGLPHDRYLRIAQRADDLTEYFPYFVEVVNLSRADEHFLKRIAQHWMYLGGKFRGWVELQQKAAI